MKLETLDSIFNLAAPIPALADVEMYCEMREDYLERCTKLPTMKRCQIGLLVGAYAFDLPLDRIVAHNRTPAIGIARQKMMAFCRVVDPQNFYSEIAHTFQRSHSTVMYAVRKYGPSIAAALEVSK